MTNTKEFVVELGTEEIPARMMEDALDRLEEQFDDWLESHNLDHGEATDFEVYGTPRRLVLTGTLPAKQADSTETIKGPPVDVAYDEDGEPTQWNLSLPRFRDCFTPKISAGTVRALFRYGRTDDRFENPQNAPTGEESELPRLRSAV